MLPDENRLRLATEFAKLRKNGQKFVHPLVILVCLPNHSETTKFAFPASKKTGGAVQRNRARRLLRESVRLHFQADFLEPGWDCLLIVRGRTKHSTFFDVHSAVNTVFKRAGLIKTNKSVSTK